MELKRIGIGWRGALVALLGVLLLGYGTFVVAHLLMTVDVREAFESGAFLLAIPTLLFAPSLTIGLCVYPWVALQREGRLQALANHDPAVVFTAATQPDRAPALRAGESLQLYYRSRTSTWQVIPLLVLLCLLLAASGEALVFAAISAFGHSALNPFFISIPILDPATTTVPTALDWVAAAYPVVIALLYVFVSLPFLSRDRFHQIRADDQGVAVRNGHERRFIPWNDILLFARVTPDTHSLPAGGYVLWGRAGRVRLTIASADLATMRSSTRSKRTSFSFKGGYNTYRDDAGRLLATIAARANAPLLSMRKAPLLTRFRRRAPVTTTSAEDALVLPLAGQEYQPDDADSRASLVFGEHLRLRPRYAPLSVLGETLLYAILMAAAFAVVGVGIVTG